MVKDTTKKPLTKRQLKIIEQAVSMRQQDVIERDDMGFLTRLFVQCNLPHSDPGNDLRVWTRTNGDTCLSIQPKWYVKEGKETCVGYPYGNIPRLLLIYLCTHALQTKNPKVSLGASLSTFMRDLGMDITGGRWGSITRLKDQMRRLFNATIQFTYETPTLTVEGTATIVRQSVYWWDNENPDQSSFFESYVMLNLDFFKEIIDHPIPLDMGIVSTIKQSPLGLDLYLWLTHRVAYLKKPQMIPWTLLAQQLGTNYERVRDIKPKVRKELNAIRVLWPSLKIEEKPMGLFLVPSLPSVASLPSQPATLQ